MQSGLQQGRQMLNQPLPPIVYGLKGFLMVVDEIEGFDIASMQPPESIDMRFLLATDNAPGLFAMGSLFSPELAELNLQADGKPVRFDSPQLQAPIDSAFLAMTDNALAMAVGEGSDTGLGPMLQAPAGTPPSFMSMHMDAARYYSFIGDAVMAQDSNDTATTARVNSAVKHMLQSMGGLVNRLSMDVNLTQHGIEMPTVITLAD
jgi:hypothetical protein